MAFSDDQLKLINPNDFDILDDEELERLDRILSVKPTPEPAPKEELPPIKQAQEQAAGRAGKVASKLFRSSLKPGTPFPTVKAAGAGTAKLAELAIRNPREALITAGAIAAPIATGGTSLIPTAIAAGLGAGGGRLIADIGEAAIDPTTAAPTATEAVTPAALTGAGTAALTLTGGAVTKAAVKQGSLIVKALANPKLKEAGKAIGQAEEVTGLSRIRPQIIPSKEQAFTLVDEVEKVSRNLDDIGTDELFRIHKTVQAFFDNNPAVSKQAGSLISKSISPIRKELAKRVPVWGQANAAFGREFAKEIGKKTARSALVKEAIGAALVTGAGLVFKAKGALELINTLR